LRIVTFNIEASNARYREIADFVAATSPDIVFIQEIDAAGAADLARRLGKSYPRMFQAGQRRNVGLALFSKHPCVETRTVDRTEFRPGVIRAHVRREATNFDVMNVYLADPFHPQEQARHIAWLIDHVRTCVRPLIVAGDFNLTPFSAKLTKFAFATGLRRHGTLLASWPADKFRPAFLIDNVLASPELCSAGVTAGPLLGSDHRPIIADIVMCDGPLQGRVEGKHFTIARARPPPDGRPSAASP
jgi:endonuclease/exonuclease/phosphatase (EEP) superfamily protein YafD